MKATLRLFLVLVVMTFSSQVWAQQQETQKTDQATKNEAAQDQKGVQPEDEILLDALHLDAQIEKPSVSIVPKRIVPRLDGIEYIIRNFDQELLRIPDELFDFEMDRRKFSRISDIDKILSRSRN